MTTVYTIVSAGAVVTAFSDPQNAADHPGYVEMADTDPRWIAWEAAATSTVPKSVSRAQFFHAAAQAGIITNAEAIAVFTGVVPASLSTAIATLSASQQFAAKIAILGNTTFERANPLLIALGAAMGQTPAQIDALFTLAASL